MRQLVDQSINDFLKIWLFVEGPERILAWAASYDSTIEWENPYAHNCDACRALFSDPRVQSVIQNNYHERIDDVLRQYAIFSVMPGVKVPIINDSVDKELPLSELSGDASRSTLVQITHG